MNASRPNKHQLTHRIASEINRVLAESGMTIDDLAAQIVESPAFIRRVLEGEDGLGKLIPPDFLQAVADATGRTMYLKIPPQRPVKRKKAVKSEGGSQS